MIRSIGFSVLTQMAASGGTFVVIIVILRLLSLDLFGLYVLLNLYASLNSQIVNAACGNVYQVLLPTLERRRHSYERNFNTLHLMVLAPVTAASVAACLMLSPQLASEVGVPVISLFIVSVSAVQGLKLQVAANGGHQLIFQIEVMRQTALIAIVAIMAWIGSADLSDLLLAHALTGLMACSCMMIGVSWRLRFRHLGWVTRRHFRYARFLVPSTLVNCLPMMIMWMLVNVYFGPETLGVLRAADVPFSLLNPLKSSLAYFLPRAIHSTEQAGKAGSRRFLLNCGAALVFLFGICVSLWAISIFAFPILTGKVYPAGIGLIFAFSYFSYTVGTITEMYLNILDRSDLVLNQNVLGGMAALGVFFATAPLVGYLAGALAVGASALVMALYSLGMLARHWQRVLAQPGKHANARR